MDILIFIWRWRVSTTAVISTKFFSPHNLGSSYDRLRRLKDKNYIQSLCFDIKDHRYVWALTSRGYKAISQTLGDLAEDSFESEAREHDLYCAACLLGEWLVNIPTDVQVFSEHELKAFSLDQYPSWVPKTNLHRPDGYWSVPYHDSKLTIALELERTVKASSRYQVPAKFYRDIPQINRVVWVVNTVADAKKIQNKILETVGEDSVKHLFLLLKDFKENGWFAKFILGIDASRTLGYLLGFDGAVNSALLADRSTWSTFAFFNTNKRPVKSVTYFNSEKRLITDRVAISSHSPLIPNPEQKEPNEINALNQSIELL